MSRNKKDITGQVYDVLINKIEDYNQTMEENKIIFSKLLDIIKEKANDRSLQVNTELISRVDDVLDDAMNVNITIKLLIQCIHQNKSINLSSREPERTVHNQEWNKFIKDNNLLPIMYLLYSNNYISQ
jgi:hypothetical protein